MKFCITIFKMFWQRLGWLKSRPAVKNVWAIPWLKVTAAYFTENGTQLDLYKWQFGSSFISFGKMVCNVFWAGSEYNYVKFHCLDLNLWSRVLNVKIFCFKILSGWPQFVWLHCKHSAQRGQTCLWNSSASSNRLVTLRVS